MRAFHAQPTDSSRRRLLRQLAGASLCFPIGRGLAAQILAALQVPPEQPEASQAIAVSDDDNRLLEEIEKAHFLFFWEQANPQTGLVRDRVNVRSSDSGVVASIAATGFGLTALCIAERNGYVPPSDARNRVLATMRFIRKKLPTHRGFFYHFANVNTGERIWDAEVSSVDTAILLAGVLTCRSHFEAHSEISNLAFEIFNRVDWTWLSEDTSLLTHGWTPESGFLP